MTEARPVFNEQCHVCGKPAVIGCPPTGMDESGRSWWCNACFMSQCKRECAVRQGQKA